MLVAKAAEAKKVADQKEFKSRLAFIRNKLLMEMMLDAEGKAAVTDAVDEARSTTTPSSRWPTSRRCARATSWWRPRTRRRRSSTRSSKGTDFAEWPRQKSKDPGAAAEGGDLGYFSKDQMVPEFAEAAFKLDKGQISEPVKTQFGWHVIKVEDKRAKPRAGVRPGQGPGRDLCDAQGAGRLRRQAARRRQDRAAGQEVTNAASIRLSAASRRTSITPSLAISSRSVVVMDSGIASFARAPE